VYAIRFHGRGGQGVKTAARILGSAFFAEGFEVQDAPRYGAERRGAPIFATVRAARAPIHARGAIAAPDLVVVVDETLVPVATAGVLVGVAAHTVLLIRSAESEAVWRERLRLGGPIVVLPDDGAARTAGAACAGAAARLLGVISRAALERAVSDEVAELGAEAVAASLAATTATFEAMAPHAHCVREGAPPDIARLTAPDWIDLPLEPPDLAAPDVFAAATSVAVRTGLWRTLRPVIDHSLCHRCTWVCVTACPDAAIERSADGRPAIDYDHCKGCLVCVAVCPPHAIHAVPERDAARADEAAR
jgi:pyruvate ferredoxin oxidoreductase gamma subunit